MQAIKCELCGSGELIKKDSMFVCQYCGTKYTVEEARKLLGTVRIDKTDIKQNNRTLARRAMQNGDLLEAKRYYDTLLVEEPNNWEPYFYSAYCRVMKNDDLDAEEECISLLYRTIISTIQLIAEYVDSPEEQGNALQNVLNSLNSYILSSAKLVNKNYIEHRYDYNLNYKWLNRKVEAYGSLYETYKNAVNQYFSNAYGFISQADQLLYDYVNTNKKSVSWIFRHEIIKRVKK